MSTHFRVEDETYRWVAHVDTLREAKMAAAGRLDEHPATVSVKIWKGTSLVGGVHRGAEGKHHYSADIRSLTPENQK